MNVEEFREYCISLGDVTEKMPFGKFAKKYDSILVFYVFNHMFCLIDIENFQSVNITSASSSVGKPINKTIKHWIQLDFDGDISTKDILEFVRRAYEITYTIHAK